MICEHRTPTAKVICSLNLYGGRPSAKTCEKCIASGENNKRYAKELFARAERIGLGDQLERIAGPIAKALGLPCHDKETGRLKPESGCAKRRDWANKKFPL